MARALRARAPAASLIAASRSALGARRSALGARRSALGAEGAARLCAGAGQPLAPWLRHRRLALRAHQPHTVAAPLRENPLALHG